MSSKNIFIGLAFLLILAVGGIWAYNFYKGRLSSTTQYSTPERSEVPQGFAEYKDEALGISFVYPKEWGDVEYSKSARNQEKLEPVKSHLFGFTNSDTYLFISPDNWTFSGSEGDWNFPTTNKSFNENKQAVETGEYFDVRLLNEANKIAFIRYEGIEDNIYIYGFAKINFPKIPASYVEINGPSSDKVSTCKIETVKGVVSSGVPSRACYSEDYISQFIELVKSVKPL